MFERKIHSIGVDEKVSYGKRWTKLRGSERESLKVVVEFLKKSKTGLALLNRSMLKAREQGKSLMDIILPGNGSLTDTTLLRRFSPSNPEKVVYETRSKVFLNRKLSFMNAVLDLAHELTHLAFRNPFNPYKSKFSIKGFVSSTVEGKGGEVDAYIIECKVFYELFAKEANGRTNCDRVIDPKTGKLSKIMGIKEFYKIGRYYNHFRAKMGRYRIPSSSFDDLSNKEAQFISSAYGVPYPVAAIQEYESIMQRVCENDKKRLALMQENLQRAPASPGLSQRQFQQLSQSYAQRCAAF